MSKGAYIGVNNVAHKIKKGYIGIDGVARRIKKAYIGIGGVARPCWSGGELVYYGNLSKISSDIDISAGASTNSCAIFKGTYEHHSFNNNLTLSSSDAGNAIILTAAASTGDYVLFAGGKAPSDGDETNDDVYSRLVTAVNNSLTWTNPTNSLSGCKSRMTGTSLGNYAIFGGGFEYRSETGGYYYSTGEVYNNLTKISTPNLSFGFGGGSASATLGNYAISAGGDTTYKILQVCDLSLTNISTNASLSTSRAGLGATSVGNYIIFAGGGEWNNGSYNTPTSIVEIFDISLTKYMTTNLSSSGNSITATTLDKYAIFSGGSGSTVCDVYDSSLTHQNMPVGLGNIPAASTIGDYAIFIGSYPIVFTLR